MLKWMSDKMGGGSSKTHLKDLKGFVETLRTVGDVEMGSLADLAMEYRIIFERKNILVSDPISYIKTKPAILMRFEMFVKDLEKSGEVLKAAAVNVWLHTLRASLAISKDSESYDFRMACKEMWKQIGRGFSEETGMNEYPKGFNPAD